MLLGAGLCIVSFHERLLRRWVLLCPSADAPLLLIGIVVISCEPGVLSLKDGFHEACRSAGSRVVDEKQASLYFFKSG